MQLEKDCLPEPGQDAWPIGKRAAFFTFFLSCTFLLLDFIDRQVLAALFPYLKQDMGLSDTQLGLLVSVVNVSIAVLTLPTGYLIDRIRLESCHGSLCLCRRFRTSVRSPFLCRCWRGGICSGSPESDCGQLSPEIPLHGAVHLRDLREYRLSSRFAHRCVHSGALGMASCLWRCGHTGYARGFSLYQDKGFHGSARLQSGE